MMQTLPLQMAAQPKTSIAPQVITLSNGNLQQLQKGDIVQVTAEQTAQNRLQASIFGQQVNIEGLNKNLIGQQISLKVIKTGQHPQLELLNQALNSKSTNSQSSEANKLEKQSINSFPAHIKSIIPTWIKHSKHAIPATAIQHKSQHTTILKVWTPALHEGKTTTETIRISSPSRAIKLGENFTIRIDTQQHNTLILQADKSRLNQLEKSLSSNPIKTDKNIQTANHAPVKVGDMINTMVQKRLPTGQISFHWQQHTFEADAPTHVKIGDGLQLKVTQTGIHTEFDVVQHVAQGHKKAAKIFRQHIGQHEPQHKNLNTLLQAIKAMPSAPNQAASATQLNPVELLGSWVNSHTLNGDKNMDGKALANSLQQLGQSFEKSLLQSHSTTNIQQVKHHDLKAVLLQLIDFINNQAQHDERQQLKLPAQQALSRIESLQALNLLANFQSEPIRFELPLTIQGLFAPAFLSIQQEQTTYKEQEKLGSHEEKQSFHILFALNLKHLGDVRIDARVDQHAVYALFYHNNHQAKNFIKENLPRLQLHLQKLGFNELHLSTSMENRMPKEKKNDFSNLINLSPSSDGLLDIQA